MAFASLFAKAASLDFLIIVAQYLLAYLRSPLKKLPGPFLAKFSDWWRFWIHYGQTHIETQKKLHAKYGAVVRIGPSAVSLADPSLIKTIYSTRGTFLKSEFYSVNDALENGRIVQNIFGTRDNTFHAQQLKPIQKLYSFQSALELEPMMNDTLRTLCSELEQRFMQGVNAGKTCDLADWIGYFTWDFLSDMTFSKRMGFIEKGEDIGGMLKTAEKATAYFSVIGQMPALDKLLAKNPYLPFKFSDFSLAAGFCVRRFMERMENLEHFKDRKDFLNSFIQAKQEYPDLVTDHEVIGYLIINILGGADTTAILLKALTYNLLRYPDAHARLTHELRSSALPYPVSYRTLESLPYLSACIEEALRIHPVVGNNLERIVPASGLTVTLHNGEPFALPPGTIVGMNPWIVHYDANIYGADPESFIPERWLQGKNETVPGYEARLKRMRDVDLSFGKGNRACLGRPLALVEASKVAATLFGRYKIELEDPSQEWELHKQWFVWPDKIKVKMSSY